MEQTIPQFLQYGAMGILALGFIVLLILFVRADKRAQVYAGSLKDAAFDRSTLIQVVAENSRAYTALAEQIRRLSDMQDRNTDVIEKLSSRLENDRCPLLKENVRT